MKRLAQRAKHHPVRMLPRPFRPQVRLLEERALPGDTILGALVAHGLVGTAATIADSEPLAERASLPGISRRLLVGDHLPDSVSPNV